jgi:general secretion pathway protein D
MIRDEDRVSVNKIPILGDLPVLGKLFSSTEKQKVKSDVVLTITPRVIRGLAAPEGGVQSFWSGTEETYGTQPLFSPSEAVSRPGVPGEAAPLSSPAQSPPPVSFPPLPPGERPLSVPVPRPPPLGGTRLPFQFPALPSPPILPGPSTAN